MKIELAPMIGAEGFCEWLRELGHVAEVQKSSASDPYHRIDGLDAKTSSRFVSHLLVQYHEDPFGAATEVASPLLARRSFTDAIP
jgi:hypothetical protein